MAPRRGFGRALTVTLTTALVAASCGASGDGPFLEPASSIRATTTTVEPTAADTVELTQAESVPTDGPELVLAAPDGPTRWSPASGPQVVAEIETEMRHVVDDGDGGLVGLTVDDQLLANLQWWPAEGDPVLLRSQGGLALHDSTTRNESPAVMITYSPIDTPEPAQVLDLLDLATTSSRTVLQVGDATTGAASAAAGPDGVAITRVELDCSEVLMFDDAGQPVADRALPARVCSDGEPVYGPVAVTDDGATLAVAINRAERGWVIATADRGADTVVELPLGDSIAAVTSLDLSPRYLAFATGSSSHLIDLEDLTLIDLGVVASAVHIVAPA